MRLPLFSLFVFCFLLCLALWWGRGWTDHPQSIFNKVRFHGKKRFDGAIAHISIPSESVDHVRNDLFRRVRDRDEELMDPDEGVPYLIRRSAQDPLCSAILTELNSIHSSIRVDLQHTNEKYCSVIAVYETRDRL